VSDVQIVFDDFATPQLQKIATICFSTSAVLSFRPNLADERFDSAFCIGDIHSCSPCINRFQSCLTPKRNRGNIIRIYVRI
jgi:hypothetical protein